MKLKASPVKVLAQLHELDIFQPVTLKDAAAHARIAAVNADVMIVAAYGLIIPTPILNMPHLGCYNIHASLLPRWRGAAPIHRALLAGDTETGVTIMQVVPALDAGAMVSRAVVPITENDTTQMLHDALSIAGAKLMLAAMTTLAEHGVLTATVQDEALVTYAHKLEKAESAIDWQKTAVEISRHVRAFNPYPVATGLLKAEVCRIWMATAIAGTATAGEIVGIDDGLLVGCGAGLLRITELQAPGGKRLNAQVFIQGHALAIGDSFTVFPAD